MGVKVEMARSKIANNLKKIHPIYQIQSFLYGLSFEILIRPSHAAFYHIQARISRLTSKFSYLQCHIMTGQLNEAEKYNLESNKFFA